jgi:hypothetical protein
MAGSMSLDDLADDFKRSLHDSAGLFAADDYADLKRFLKQALPDMGTKRPRTRLGQVTVVADLARYSLAAYTDFVAYKTHLWDRNPANGFPQPWEPGYPGATPRVCAVNDGDAAVAWWLEFSPAPSAAHLAVMGSTFKFYYFAQHALGTDAANTTVAPADRGLLLLRAQAEAMREMVLHQANKPVQLRDGLSGTPRNSTPAALHEMLLRLFWEAR